MPSTQWETSKGEQWHGAYFNNRRHLQQTSSNVMHRSRGLQHQTLPAWAMPLPDEQELDHKRPMVSPVAVQRSQTASHKQQAKHTLQLLKDSLKHQPSPEETPSHGVVTRHGLFCTASFLSATDCLPAAIHAPGPSQRRPSLGTASECDWVRPSSQPQCRYCT